MFLILPLAYRSNNEGFNKIQPFLRQLVVFSTLSARRYDKTLPAGLTVEVYRGALLRAFETLKKAGVEEPITKPIFGVLEKEEAALPKTMEELALTA